MNREWQQIIGVDVLAKTAAGGQVIPECFSEEAAGAARRFHQAIAGYHETPLISLPELAKALAVKKIYVKDESRRFSLNAFKGLGGSYAMFRILCERLRLDPQTTRLGDLLQEDLREQVEQITFVTATDGNHGRGVSWAAGLLGCRVHVYMPAGSAAVRAEAIRQVGPAQVTITEMNYDDTVKFAARQSEENGWYLIQDTAWPGYEKIPAWIIQGYLTMAAEAAEQMAKAEAAPTHLFLQAGVGAMAGGVLGYFAKKDQNHRLTTIIVEPEAANCIYVSAKAADGHPHSVAGMPETIMAGLNCGTPCSITWPVLRDYADYYLSCPDFVAAHGMRRLARPSGSDPAITAGESGAAAMGALCLLLERPEFAEVKKQMGLNQEAVVLVINTEGDTDPEGYKQVVEAGRYPVPAGDEDV